MPATPPYLTRVSTVAQEFSCFQPFQLVPVPLSFCGPFIVGLWSPASRKTGGSRKAESRPPRLRRPAPVSDERECGIYEHHRTPDSRWKIFQKRTPKVAEMR